MTGFHVFWALVVFGVLYAHWLIEREWSKRKMPELTPAEAKRLAQIDAAMKPLKAERAAILNRARVRAHYARKKQSDASDAGT